MLVKNRFSFDEREFVSIVNNDINKILSYFNINEYFPEKEYTEYTFLAKKVFNCPIAFISFIGGDSLLVKSAIGLDNQFIQHKIDFQRFNFIHDSPFIVNDTLCDKNFLENSLVCNSPYIRFYAAVPLITSFGIKIGNLCIMNNKVSYLSDSQILYLQYLANRIVQKLELRRENILLNNSFFYKKYVLSANNLSKEIITKHINNKLIKIFFKVNLSNEKYKTIKIKDLIYAINYYFKHTLNKYGIKFNIYIDLDKNSFIECKPAHTMKNLIRLLNISIETVKAEKCRWINLNIKNLVYNLEFSITNSCKIKNYYSSSLKATQDALL